MSEKVSPETLPAHEVDAVSAGPDPDDEHARLMEALSGTNAGSDTRSGSLRGGSAGGSEVDPDQIAIDAALALRGGQPAEPVRTASSGDNGVDVED